MALESTTAERLASLEARADIQDEVRADLKSVLATVQNIEVHMAKVPTYVDLSAVKTRVETLEKESERRSGAWKMICALAALIGGAIGVAATFFSGLFNGAFKHN